MFNLTFISESYIFDKIELLLNSQPLEFPLNNLPVLIVGAGPTGLMMACILAQYGIHFRIIDKKPERTLASNATWIQTRTIELLDQMGIVDRFTKAGHPCDAINLYTDGKHLSKLSLKNVDSIYPFILMLPQCETEKLLEDYLRESHHTIERSIELIDVKCSSNIVTSTLKYADGHTETVTSNWLIACDGANSIVREKCGLHFPGEDLKEQFMVADATINFSHMSKDEIHFFFDPGTVLAAFPLGKNRYRLAANLHLDYPRKNFYEQEVIELVQERAHGKYYVSDVTWISPFWIHGKVAEHMQKGPIFLVGDAAHIHSPAGGQGMNTGMQDAYNLAWKLALVIKDKAKSSLLESYESERNPIVKEIVAQNEHLTKLALFDENFLSRLKKLSQELANDSNIDLEKKISNQLTQLNIRYENSPIINYEHKQHLLQPGQHAPNQLVGQSTLYRYFNITQHTILLFAGQNPTNETLEKISKLQKSLANQYPDLIKSYVVHKEQLNDLNTIVDSHGSIHQSYQINNPAIYIIRPDTYISYYSEDLNIESIEKSLRTYLY